MNLIKLKALNKGFTLVELLVALALLAITSALAFRGLSAVGEHRNRVEGQRLRSVQIEQTFAQLQADVDHLMTMSAAASGQNAPPVMQRADGVIFLRRPRALLADTVTKATASEATIDAIRYQATGKGLVRTVLGRARDPLDMVGRVLGGTVQTDATGQTTDGLSRVSLLPEARAIEVLAWSLPTSAGLSTGGDWIPLSVFNTTQNTNAENAQNPANSPPPQPAAAAASSPTSAASAPGTGSPPSLAATPRALKVRLSLESGAILERIYMAGPNG